MAISHRDRVNRAFELFAEGATPFIDEHMTAHMRAANDDWATVIAARDEQRHGRRTTINKSDPQVQIRMLLEEWRAFSRVLGQSHRNLAGLLKDARNKLAHHETFSADETYRALDTIELLLQAMGAAEQAEAVRRGKVEHQRAVYAEETRRDTKTSIAKLVEGVDVKSWRKVIVPHQDVRDNAFHAAEFAADLWQVAHGDTAGDEYAEPVEFFRRTYLTEGLRDLLDRAVRRVSGDANASPVVNLQTNFGGGKTHSMLALYHVFSGRPLTAYPQDVQELLAGRDLTELGDRVRRVVLVGNRLAAHGLPAKPDGTRINTLWGELAWQLGGRPAYDSIVDSDASRTNPGAALTELIAAYAPCVILIDEWVAYARELFGRDDLAGGTFETQFTFAQTLTEAVAAVPGALLVVSIPASHRPEDSHRSTDLEVGGPNGQAALNRLQHVVRRLADNWRPASAEESFEIVRRRLFETPNGDALRDIAAVAHQFTRFYHQHKGEFPSGCSERDYEQRIRAAYPIHPELFDRLYGDWSTLDRFQRTRGVLRLMSKVIHTLWISGDAGPLIMPGSVPLDVSAPRDELTQYLEDAWKPILDKDVDAPQATPAAIDATRPAFQQRALTQRIARTIFLGSAPTIKSGHKGIDQQRIWLGVAIPGDVVGNFGSALHLLGERATYLYSDRGRWWYDVQESVARTAADIADRLRERPEEAWALIVRRLRKEQASPGDFVRLHAAPENSADIPDDPEARLVVLHPRHTHTRGATDSDAIGFARNALDTRGTGQRVNRNMLVFLAPDHKRVAELETAARQFIAWDQIQTTWEERNLDPAQRKLAETRRAEADHAVNLRIPETYTHALVPVQPQPDRPVQWETVRAEGSTAGLGPRTSAKLRQSDLLRVQHGVRNIRLDLEDPKRLAALWERGHISVGELWALYCKYPYLARLRNRQVLDTAVRSVLDEIAWTVAGFALAAGYDDTDGRYLDLTLPHEDGFGQVVDSTLIVDAGRARAQRDLENTERQAEEARRQGVPVDVVAPGVTYLPSGGGPEPAAPIDRPAAQQRPKRFFGVYQVDPNPLRRMKLLTDLDREVLQHLAADPGVALTISVEITATNSSGFTEDRVRTVRENARALRFEQAEFEDE
ncbi:Swt1 family HEPN domain-containing protein [Plantactinospora sp. B6F1]|uniref:Swt1 family HEPN domain-containing protein n=1 Tax=Plantactinospora sp. B6F1 TaxID=3158971 RepID=UPI0032D92B48